MNIKIINKKNNINNNILSTGILYIVPTPIGNLGDITHRALTVLSSVDLIAVEDTRHTGLLLQHFSITKKLFALNNYNEKHKTKVLLLKLQKGLNIALVSDAGTPLINDPGYDLVFHCIKLDIKVIPLPGACAAITALTGSGLPCNRFCYEGFLPKKFQERHQVLLSVAHEKRTLIFYETNRRVVQSLKDMIEVFGAERHIVLARELTKLWESFYAAPISQLLEWILEDDNRIKGEIVLIVAGYDEGKTKDVNMAVLKTLELLQKELTLKTAIGLTAKIHKVKKNLLNKYVLNLKKSLLDKI